MIGGGACPAVPRGTMNYIEKARKLDKLATTESKAQEMNRLIDEAARELAEDRADKAAEALQEIAYMFSKGGQDGFSMFESMRKLVITKAQVLAKTDFLAEKLKVAEQDLRDNRRQIYTGSNDVRH